MIDILRLNDQWLQKSYSQLCSGLSLSRLVAATVDWYAGEIVAWVPPGVTSLESETARRWTFKDAGNFDVSGATHRLFDYHLSRGQSQVIVADSYTTTSDVNRGKTVPETGWFSFRSSGAKETSHLCVYLSSFDANSTAYNQLLNEASPYPRTIVLTSLVRDEQLVSGVQLDPSSTPLSGMVSRLDYVMLGAFDEMSFMIWKRPSLKLSAELLQ